MSTTFNVGFSRLLKRAEDAALKNAGVGAKSVTPNTTTTPQPVATSNSQLPVSGSHKNTSVIEPSKMGYRADKQTYDSDVASNFNKPINPLILSKHYNRNDGQVLEGVVDEKTKDHPLTPAQREMVMQQSDIAAGGGFGSGGIARTNLLKARDTLNPVADISNNGTLFQKGELAYDVGPQMTFGDDANKMLSLNSQEGQNNLTTASQKIKQQGANYGDNAKMVTGGAGVLGIGALLAMMGGEGGQQSGNVTNNYGGPGMPQEMRDDPYKVRNFNTIS